MNSELRPTTLSFGIKRLADILFSVLALLLLWPAFIIIAICILLNSGSPIFFTQERIGKDGKPFRIFKFRTMRMNAEENGPQLSNPTDLRITWIGHFLRRYRLDELPQFINIIRGEMSLVGPRPERPYFIEQLSRLTPDFPTLLQMKPGLTSWGQVKYGYASTVEQISERMQYDLYYIRHFSLLFDLKIILHTIKIVFSGKGV